MPIGAMALAGGAAAKAADFRGSARRLLFMMRPERPLVYLALALATVSVVLTVIGPKLLGDATNVIFAGVLSRDLPADASKVEVVEQLRRQGNDTLADMVNRMDLVPGQGIDFGLFGKVILVALVVYAVAAVFSLFQGRVTAVIVQRLAFRLRERTQAKLARLPLSYFDGRPPGEILSRTTNDIDNLTQTLQQTLNQLVTSLLTVVGVLVMMLVISPLLAVIALVTVPVSVYVTKVLGKRARPKFGAQWAMTGRLNGHIEEMYAGHSLVRTFGRRKEVTATFAQMNDVVYNASFKAQFLSGMTQPALTFVGNLNFVLIAIVGALRVTSGSLTLGDVQAFIQYSRQFSQPLTQVASIANLLQSAVASAERVFELLDAEEQRPDQEEPARLPEVRGRVEFQDISFRYTPDTPLIENLSLVVEPGQTVAIVGPTGAGKTTLVNLLMRFYELDEGRILVDGVDVATLTRDELRSKIGMVLQDPWLLEGTITENIAYGADDPAPEEIVAAARAAHVDRFARTLPDGYDTVIDSEGGSVSTGERQLITIARGALTGPPILILDEATSSVDTRTERLIQEAMNSLRTGRTSFVIAHRLSTIREADLILVMDSGRIVEQGTHDDLIEANGTYARLYAAQFAEAAVTVD